MRICMYVCMYLCICVFAYLGRGREIDGERARAWLELVGEEEEESGGGVGRG